MKDKNPGRLPDSLVHAAYRAATGGLFWGLGPSAWALSRVSGRPVPGLAERLGSLPDEALARDGHPRIWVHAASVGEVSVADAVLDAILDVWPRAGLILSTFTAAGREQAGRVAGDRAACVYAPLDFGLAVRRALNKTRPHALVLLETELWPNWIAAAKRCGSAVVLANGRISERSFSTAMKARPFYRHALTRMDAFSMISAGDAERIIRLGAPRERVRVSGNAKVDALAGKADPGAAAGVEALLGLPAEAFVFAAGSTRTGEDALVLDAFQALAKEQPDARLILAPRHVRRVPEIVRLLSSRSLSFETLTSLEKEGGPLSAPILLVDSMGRLFDLYSRAQAVFCGGSLAPLGGQNILEPAAWGKPVLFGPHMGDFADARDLLVNSGGALTVADGEELSAAVTALARKPRIALAMGQNARFAVDGQRGAAKRHVQALGEVLNG